MAARPGAGRLLRAVGTLRLTNLDRFGAPTSLLLFEGNDNIEDFFVHDLHKVSIAGKWDWGTYKWD
jgi:hypothetical protein